MRLRLLRFSLILFIIVIYCFICFGAYNGSNDLNVSNEGNLKVNNNVLTYEKHDSYDSDYLANIRIPKINIDRKLYNVGSKNNTVDKNIEVLKESDMPDKVNGNFILAAHNGQASIAYFHNLHKLEINDEVLVDYNNNVYKYIVSDIYDVPKTGKVAIKRDKNKTSITMITCKDDDKQLVVIGYLK